MSIEKRTHPGPRRARKACLSSSRISVAFIRFSSQLIVIGIFLFRIFREAFLTRVRHPMRWMAFRGERP
jgi:hypothetical protein